MKITLTIDNGPDLRETPRVLDVLARHGVAAYFFIVGQHTEPPGALEVLRAIADHGHHIGNHTWSHATPFGVQQDPDAVAAEVVRTRQRLAPVIGTTRYFRPFGGGGKLDRSLLSPALVDHLVREHYTCVLWNSVPRDWLDEGWVSTALDQVSRLAWAVTVVHDNIPGNAQRIEAFIVAARDLGYEFTSDLPDDCVPIKDGSIQADLAPLGG